MPGPRFYKRPLSSCCDGSCRRRQMPALRGRMGRCRPYVVLRMGRCRPDVVWASHVEVKPIPHRNMKRSPHHVGPASAHSAYGLASADRSGGSEGRPRGAIFQCSLILIKTSSGKSLMAGQNIRKVLKTQARHLPIEVRGLEGESPGVCVCVGGKCSLF